MDEGRTLVLLLLLQPRLRRNVPFEAGKLVTQYQTLFCYFSQVNIDFQTRELTRRNMQEPSLSCFDQAQGKVHSLMEKDSYPRFLRSKIYTDLLSQTQRRLS